MAGEGGPLSRLGVGFSATLSARAQLIWDRGAVYLDAQGKVDYSLRRESIRRECEASLRRLKTEVIDLYQIHWTADDINENTRRMGRTFNFAKGRQGALDRLIQR
jgi:aryl-alcohol dehydrogenase-like predicted oxidoreductase